MVLGFSPIQRNAFSEGWRVTSPGTRGTAWFCRRSSPHAWLSHPCHPVSLCCHRSGVFESSSYCFMWMNEATLGGGTHDIWNLQFPGKS